MFGLPEWAEILVYIWLVGMGTNLILWLSAGYQIAHYRKVSPLQDWDLRIAEVVGSAFWPVLLVMATIKMGVSIVPFVYHSMRIAVGNRSSIHWGYDHDHISR